MACGQNGGTDMKECPKCGRMIPINSVFCNFCGHCYSNQMNIEEVLVPANYFKGFLLSDLDAVIGNNHKIYMEKFRLRKIKGYSFNWSSFIFGIYWMFYRKMWSYSLILWGVNAAVAILIAILGILTHSLVFELILSVLKVICIEIFFGFYADVLYWKHIKKILLSHDCRKRPPVYDEELTETLISEGGTLSIGEMIGIMFLYSVPQYLLREIVKSLLMFI